MEGFSLRSSSSTEDSLGDRKQSIALYIYQCMHPRLCVIRLVLIDTVNKVGQILVHCWRYVYQSYFPLTAADFFFPGMSVYIKYIRIQLNRKAGWFIIQTILISIRRRALQRNIGKSSNFKAKYIKNFYLLNDSLCLSNL